MAKFYLGEVIIVKKNSPQKTATASHKPMWQEEPLQVLEAHKIRTTD